MKYQITDLNYTDEVFYLDILDTEVNRFDFEDFIETYCTISKPVTRCNEYIAIVKDGYTKEIVNEAIKMYLSYENGV